MSHDNPFARNLLNLSITRLLQINYGNDNPPCHRPLHETQAALGDEQVQCYPCVFNDDSALITEGWEVEDELLNQHPVDGVVSQVIYMVQASLGTELRHIADTFSTESAQQLVDLLNAANSPTCSAWEISDRHLDLDSLQYLVRVIDETWYTGLAFEAFKLWKPGAFGIQLVTGYWNSLQDEFTWQDIYQEQLRNGVPRCLVDLIHLAAVASVRYVMFDPEAGQLDGLPVFDRVELN